MLWRVHIRSPVDVEAWHILDYNHRLALLQAHLSGHGSNLCGVWWVVVVRVSERPPAAHMAHHPLSEEPACYLVAGACVRDDLEQWHLVDR